MTEKKRVHLQSWGLQGEPFGGTSFLRQAGEEAQSRASEAAEARGAWGFWGIVCGEASHVRPGGWIPSGLMFLLAFTGYQSEQVRPVFVG